MTEYERRSDGATERRRGWPLGVACAHVLVLIALIPGCATGPQRNYTALHAYYMYDFTSARDAVRHDAYAKNDEQVLLNNLRLGAAALADGDDAEAERALGNAFQLLSTAGLNKDRTTAAILLHEGVRIWKGEPFEQALAYHSIAVLYAVMGDWENARAAAANALFRLTDFGGDQSPASLARRAAQRPGYLDRGYTAVDTNFALGFMMQATAADLSGAAGASELFDAARRIDPGLAPIIETLRRRAYDTLLFVDYGRGPVKIAYGPDEALAKFVSKYGPPAALRVTTVDHEVARVDAACNVANMATDHRWNNLEQIRLAKSAIGDALIMSGLVVSASSHRHRRSEDRTGQALVGASLAFLGMLTKSGARADTRYFEFAPRATYMVPLLLGGPCDLELEVVGDDGARMLQPAVAPGTRGAPRAVYVRLHGPDSPAPAWMTAAVPVYGNDHVGVRAGDYPWILGGTDVSTPSRATLAAYQAGGRLTGLTLAGLRELYAAEGIVLGAGADPRARRSEDRSYRHILEGGTGLFTPRPDSPGYKRLMFTRRAPYRPRSEVVRNLAGAIRVQDGGVPPADQVARRTRDR